jgi:hypothetical protein
MISSVKRGECVSDMVSYAIQRGRWCGVIVLNAHVPTEDKFDVTMGSFIRN